MIFKILVAVLAFCEALNPSSTTQLGGIWWALFTVMIYIDYKFDEFGGKQ